MESKKAAICREWAPGRRVRRESPPAGGTATDWARNRVTLQVIVGLAALCLCTTTAVAQSQAPGNKDTTLEQAVELLPSPVEQNAGPPLTLTLADALARAQKNSPQFQSAVTDVKLAREAHKQASAAMKPSLGYRMDYLNTQGNGISPVGRFVTNDGIHVYRAWGMVRENMPASFFISAGTRGAAYAEALARANEEIARRGLVMTVTNS